MKHKVARYKTKPERAEENARLMVSAFAKLKPRAPNGVCYLALKFGDGGPFDVHWARISAVRSAPQILLRLPLDGRTGAGKHTPERCLEAAFRFLLDREPKELILGRFDLTVISRYFPEFERELPHYLSRF